jgi:hypothetical protein
MARTDWAALVTEPAAEYTASAELVRFGLQPYLPQVRRRHRAQGLALVRLYPLFPRYLLVPIGDAQAPALRLARGLRKPRPVLTDDDGRPWRAPGDLIEALMAAERRGDFDETLAHGDRVRLASGALAGVNALLQGSSGSRAELLMPLLGGCRVRVAEAKVVRA